MLLQSAIYAAFRHFPIDILFLDGTLPVTKATNGQARHTKVLLVSPDRRFRSVAATLLTRRGCTVTLAHRATRMSELVEREVPDVVVLDAGVSLTDAARHIAQLETLDPPVGAVVVRDEAECSLAAMPVLPKWGSFDRLYLAIEQARPPLSWFPNGLGWPTRAAARHGPP